jgi:hypothetical protein
MPIAQLPEGRLGLASSMTYHHHLRPHPLLPCLLYWCSGLTRRYLPRKPVSSVYRPGKWFVQIASCRWVLGFWNGLNPKAWTNDTYRETNFELNFRGYAEMPRILAH